MPTPSTSSRPVSAAASSAPDDATVEASPCGLQHLPDAALAEVAGFFQLLSEPSRLRVLNLLREQPRCVGELARACGSSPANISRHLAQLQRHGLVDREGRGTSVFYRIADPSVYALCDLVCGQLARHHARLDATGASFLKR